MPSECCLRAGLWIGWIPKKALCGQSVSGLLVLVCMPIAGLLLRVSLRSIGSSVLNGPKSYSVRSVMWGALFRSVFPCLLLRGSCWHLVNRVIFRQLLKPRQNFFQKRTGGLLPVFLTPAQR